MCLWVIDWVIGYWLKLSILTFRCQPAHQEQNKAFYPKQFTNVSNAHSPIQTLTEQFGVQYVAQGHFDMQTEGARDRTTDLLISVGSALPPEPQRPLNTLETLKVNSRLPRSDFLLSFMLQFFYLTQTRPKTQNMLCCCAASRYAMPNGKKERDRVHVLH